MSRTAMRMSRSISIVAVLLSARAACFRSFAKGGIRVITDAFRFRVGMSLVLGLIWASAAVGDGPLFSTGVHYPTGNGSTSVAIGDLNGDQVPDLAVANQHPDNVSVLLGVGDGTFEPAVNYATGDRPRSVAIGDLNGDQVPDLVTANEAGGNVSVLLGLGNGTFATPVHYATGFSPWSVAIDDLNGDGVLDLAVANLYSDAVSVLLGVGDGTLDAAVNFPVGDGPYSVAIGDLNCDQVPDLVTANYYSDNVSVLLGVGDGTFDAAVHYAAGNGPTSIAIGDLNGDQAPDLVVANEVSDNVSVLLGGSCNGTFAAPVHYAAGDESHSVTIVDLDGDQVLDLVAPDWSSDNVLVLLGLGDGTFSAALHYAPGVGPFSVAIGDLNGDQAPDLAVANVESDNVSVLLHQIPGPFPDCNGNEVLDACDVDCGPTAGPCDLPGLPGCGQSADSNENGIPDECENGPPLCDTGGTYTAECEGGLTSIILSGTASSDPDGDPLTFLWTTDCPGGSFDDETSDMPILTVDTAPGCGVNCNVTLAVDDGNGGTCSEATTVTIADTQPPVVTCSAVAMDGQRFLIEYNASDDCREASGSAVIETLCCPLPVVSGQVVRMKCHDDEDCKLKLDFEDETFEIKTNAATLVVTATDECGNTATCEVDLCIPDDGDE